jgi:radical SAM superfamily enzyme YgiQ (UPF0313 family)
MARILLIDIPAFNKPVAQTYAPIHSELARAEIMLQSQLLVETQQIHQGSGRYLTYSRAILQLAASLELDKHEVAYLSSMDRHFWERLFTQTVGFDVVGVTCMTASYPILQRVCEVVREQNAQAVIVVGGYHVSYLAHQVLEESPAIDIVVRGDGDDALRQIAATRDYAEIPNSTFRDAQGEIQDTPTARVVSMNQVPPPAFHLLNQPLQRYFHNLITTRGCKYDCRYCVDGYLPLRYAGIERTIQELKFWQAQLPPGQLVYFADNVFSSNRRRMILLARAIAKEVPGLRFGCELRYEDIDEEVIQELAAANFVWLSTAVEDANDSVLGVSQRKIPFDSALHGLELMRRHAKGLINIAWVTGLPGSTSATLQNNMDQVRYLLSENLVDQITNRVFVPYPGTEIFHHPERFDLKLRHTQWADYDRTAFPVYDLETLSAEEIYAYFLDTERAILDTYSQRIP